MKFRRPYPSEIATAEHHARGFGVLLGATALLVALTLFGCDATSSSATADGDSTRIHIDTTIATPGIASHVLEVCAVGEDPKRECPACAKDVFTWDIEVAFSTDTVVALPPDTVQCRMLGVFADTTQFEVQGIGRIGMLQRSWFLVDGDSIPFKWDGRVNPDSLRATRWNEVDY